MGIPLREFLVAKKHHVYRKEVFGDWAAEYRSRELSPAERMADRLERLTQLETPVFLPDETIVFIRTIQNLPDIFTPEEWEAIRKKYFIHERGYLSNLTPDYPLVLRQGLSALYENASSYGRRAIGCVFSLTDRYRLEAERLGLRDTAEVLKQVPRYGARNFREALQSFRILHFFLWLEGNYHMTAGRFDQYLWPYLKRDMERGLYTEESALALLEDFFLSFNKDSDLYPGVQQGDNGQSMVLGGTDAQGRDCFNPLSALCLRASRELKLIDPKLNLRVCKTTPLETYILGTELTKEGLGFPQYSNDDIVIEGLVRKGYERKDAQEYAVAACWEFVVPKYGADVVNVGAFSFPRAVDIALHRSLRRSERFDDFLEDVRRAIFEESDRICGEIKELWFVPSPFLSVMMGVEDLAKGSRYNNFGIHGTGMSTAVDSLAAIRKYLFEERRFSAETLCEAVDSDFQVHPELLPLLRYEAPKMGKGDSATDALAAQLLSFFALSLEGRVNCRGGCYRAGTGSAMFYLWHAAQIGASPDGRRKGEPFGANFSPSLFARTDDPLSVVKAFALPDFSRAVNGGPLTLEFHSSLFSDEENVRKVAELVKYFIDLGGHQLQLNAVCAETLRDAQKHPERYPQLIVRVWGWSAYFVELDKAYQDHVIARQEYAL